MHIAADRCGHVLLSGPWNESMHTVENTIDPPRAWCKALKP